jgi:hypothetical protein
MKKKKQVKFREHDQADVWAEGLGRMWDSMSPEEQREKIELMKKDELEMDKETKIEMRSLTPRQNLINNVYNRVVELDKVFSAESTKSPQELAKSLWFSIVTYFHPVNFPDMKQIEQKVRYDSPVPSMTELREMYVIVRAKFMEAWFKNVEFTDYGWREVTE